MKKYIIILIIIFLALGFFVFSNKSQKEGTIYNNASANDIVVELPYPDAVTGKEFSVIGRARGFWFFEGSFPLEVLDENGKSIAVGYAQAEGEWMTTEFVPFKGEIKVPESYIGKAVLVLKKDNPSGIPEKDASISFKFNIEY